MNKTSICLNMIVKNETPVLDRLIHSVKDIIDYYVIIDTGSTDGTPEFIETKMAELQIPGEVIVEDWVNFGFNRDQAIKHACARRHVGWLLLIDADEELCINDPDFYKHLKPGISYCLRKHNGNLRYALPNLIDISQNRWGWQGAVHEYLEHLEGSNLRETLEEAWIFIHPGEGVRSRGFTAEQKFLRDAELLEAELQKNPEDTRSQFYLAQSYRDAGHLELAYQHYMQRVVMGGWVEEIFFAQFQAARLAALINKPYAVVVEAFLKAYEIRPVRAESLHGLAEYCRNQNQFNLAYLFAKQALEIPYPDDLLFVSPEVYYWQILDEIGVSGYWAGHFSEAKEACEEILQRQKTGLINLSAQNLQRIRENLNFADAKLNS